MSDSSTHRSASRPASLFTRMARATAHWTGRPSAFLLALGIIAGWAITGPVFQYSDTWQLVINTGTTIVTFLMVFLIQNSQNRDSEAIQLKLDELIRAIEGAQNRMIDLEEMDEVQLEEIRAEYLTLAEEARAALEGASLSPKKARRSHHRASPVASHLPADAGPDEGSTGSSSGTVPGV